MAHNQSINESTYRTKFSVENIVRFCIITQDSNNIHNPGYMAALGKHPIVPGMYTLFSAIAGINSLAFKDMKRIEACFGDPLSPVDDVEVGGICDLILKPSQTESITLLARTNGKNVLANQGKPSRLTFNPQTQPKPVFGMESTYDFKAVYSAAFSRLIGLPLLSISRTFYAVVFASHAMIESINSDDASKLGDGASELKQMLSDPKKRYLPAYSSMIINFHNGVQNVITPDVPVRYVVNLIKPEKFERDYQINLACFQSDKQIFDAEYKITPVPERGIIKYARNI